MFKFKFKKKSDATENFNDRELVAANSKYVGVLLAIVEDEDEKASLLKLQDELKYLTPSPNEKVAGYDKKIKDMLDDMRVLFQKKEHAKIAQALREVRETIALRNTLI